MMDETAVLQQSARMLLHEFSDGDRRERGGTQAKA
jgi:hypothetical protein